MAKERRKYDPLALIPSSRAIREYLDDARRVANRLAILLQVAETIESAPTIDPDEFAKRLPTKPTDDARRESEEACA